MSKEKLEIENAELLEQLSISQIKKMTPYLDKLKLTNKQRRFTYIYVMNNLNGLHAARIAGYSENGIYVRVNVLLRDPKIKKAIRKIMDNEIKIDKEKLEYNIVKKFMAVLDSDIMDYVNEKGEIKKNLSSIPKPLRQMIKKIEPKYYGKDADIRVLTLELVGKEFVINSLMKYVGMMQDDKEDKNSITDTTMKGLLDMLHGK